MPGLSDKIKHVVVLMLENRSFDCMLGRLYPDRPDFNGLTGGESNPHTGGPASPIMVWNDAEIVPGTMTIPSPDPGEVFTTAVLPEPGDDVEAHIAKLSGGLIDLVDPIDTAGEAVQVISDRLTKLI